MLRSEQNEQGRRSAGNAGSSGGPSIASPRGMRVIAMAILLVASMSRPARAEQEWSGWQSLAADVTSWLLTAYGHPAFGVGLLGSGAAVHLAHGRSERAAKSIALRLGGFGVGYAAGALVASQHTCEKGPPGSLDLCGLESLGPIFVGVAVGLAASQILDAAVLGWDDHKAEPRLVPDVTVGPGRAVVGLSGTF